MDTFFNRYIFLIKGDDPMNTLAKPRFSDLSHGESAGAPILLKLWDRFDFSFLLMQSGIIKSSGVPTSELWT